MKKHLLPFLLIVTFPAFGQLYIRANVGYHLPLSNELMGTEHKGENIPDEGYSETVSGVYGSYGTGFSVNAAVGGNFTGSVVGYDLEFGYLLGKKQTLTDQYIDPQFGSKRETTRTPRSFQFAPSITFAVGTGKIQPMARFGPVLAMTTITEEYDENYLNGYSFHYKYQLKGGVSVGFKGAVGVNYSLSESLKLFTEVNFAALSSAPTKRKITEYEVNGENRIDDIDPEFREVDLEKEGEGGGEGGDPELRRPYAMNSWGLNVGVIFYLKK